MVSKSRSAAPPLRCHHLDRSRRPERRPSSRTHTHKTIARFGCSSRRASSRAASKSSALVFDSIADDLDSTENSPATQNLSLLVFYKSNNKSQIPFFLQLKLGCVLEQWGECRGAGACYAVCTRELCACVEIFCC